MPAPENSGQVRYLPPQEGFVDPPYSVAGANARSILTSTFRTFGNRRAVGDGQEWKRIEVPSLDGRFCIPLGSASQGGEKRLKAANQLFLEERQRAANDDYLQYEAQSDEYAGDFVRRGNLSATSGSIPVSTSPDRSRLGPDISASAAALMRAPCWSKRRGLRRKRPGRCATSSCA